MTETNSDIRSAINDLIETCKDGQNGFRTAAENIDDPKIKDLFTKFSSQRATFASELQTLAREFGETKPEDSSSVAGAIHRGWMNLKTAVAGKDRHAILAECERGEDSAVKEYRKALELQLATPAKSVVNRQYAAVQSAHDQVKALRDAAKAAA